MSDDAQTYWPQIAKITATHLGWEDHGIFSLALSFDYGGGSQGLGPINLGKGDYDVAGEMIQAVMKAAGVREWGKLVGRTVYALRDGSDYSAMIRGMAPLPTEGGEGFVLGRSAIKSLTVEPYSVAP